MIISSTQIK